MLLFAILIVLVFTLAEGLRLFWKKYRMSYRSHQTIKQIKFWK
jgi:hypothetical protein